MYYSMKAIENSIEVQNKMTKKAQNTLKESNNLNTSEEHIKDTSLDDKLTKLTMARVIEVANTPGHYLREHCQNILDLFAEQQAKLLQVIEDEAVKANRMSYQPNNWDNTKTWPIIHQPCLIIPEETFKQLKDNVINGGSL